jgi:hypothetical protein
MNLFNIEDINQTVILLRNLFLILQDDHCKMCDMMDNQENYDILLNSNPSLKSKNNYIKLIIGLYTWIEIFENYKLVHPKGFTKNKKIDIKLEEMKECINDWQQAWGKIYNYYNSMNENERQQIYQ